MWNKPARGFTLVEMIVAMVIISVGLAGVLGVLSRTSVQSADPMVTKQLTAIAEGMMEEIQLKPYKGDGLTAFNGCNRTGFDEIGDYNGYKQPVCGVNGDAGAAGYTVEVNVGAPSATMLSGGIPAADMRQITVKVTQGSNSYTLTGWRSDFGANQK